MAAHIFTANGNTHAHAWERNTMVYQVEILCTNGEWRGLSCTLPSQEACEEWLKKYWSNKGDNLRIVVRRNTRMGA